MNNFINLDLTLLYISSWHSETVLQSRLMAKGYFINITSEIREKILRQHYENNINLSNITVENMNFLEEVQEESPFIITRRHKVLVRKALFFRMFYHLYNSDIKVSDFFQFISHFNNFRYSKNLNAYDFTRLEYGGFLSENSNGLREFAVGEEPRPKGRGFNNLNFNQNWCSV